MSAELLPAIIQGGAIGLLVLVLWQVGNKVDKLIDMNDKLVNKLIDLIASMEAEKRAIAKSVERLNNGQ